MSAWSGTVPTGAAGLAQDLPILQFGVGARSPGPRRPGVRDVHFLLVSGEAAVAAESRGPCDGGVVGPPKWVRRLGRRCRPDSRSGHATPALPAPCPARPAGWQELTPRAGRISSASTRSSGCRATDVLHRSLRGLLHCPRRTHGSGWPPAPTELNVPYASVVDGDPRRLLRHPSVRSLRRRAGQRVRPAALISAHVADGPDLRHGHGYEYYQFVHEGTTISPGVRGTVFFLTTGFHGLHVSGA